MKRSGTAIATVSAAMMKNFRPGERKPRELGFGILSFGNKPSHGANCQVCRGSWRNRGAISSANTNLAGQSPNLKSTDMISTSRKVLSFFRCRQIPRDSSEEQGLAASLRKACVASRATKSLAASARLMRRATSVDPVKATLRH
jgi:hypothetical protein